KNHPDKDVALSRSEDVESLVGGTVLNIWQAKQTMDMGLGFSTLADELTSQWGNWAIGRWSSEPRDEYDNSTTSDYYNMTGRPWFMLYEVISTAKDGLESLNSGMQFGDDGENNIRMEAFCRFLQGIAHGEIALIFDKAFIVDETTDLTATPEFTSYSEVMNAALGYFEECLDICDENTFVLPDEWIPGSTVDNVLLAQYAHSFMARYMAGIGRTPAEREAADWNAIMEHADAGITEDWIVQMDGNYWYDGIKYFGSREDWLKADYFVIGHADTSGAFDDWAASSPDDREPFIIQTADRRIAGPDSTTAPGTDFQFYDTFPFEGHRASYYGSIRYFDHFASGATSDVSWFNASELRLLKAEGLYRTGGDLNTVADIINETRVNRGELEPVTNNTPNLFDKIKYEKRIEVFLSAGGLMYLERRGWGELGTGSPLQFPVPAGELEVLLQDIYTYGGNGEWAAAKRTNKPSLIRFSAFSKK
ncbi:MAG: hypothetical protein P8Y99_12520, partial [Calditrichaceae bacterium]